MEDGMIHYYGDMSNYNRAFYNPYENTKFRRGVKRKPLTKSNYARLTTLTNYTTNEKKPRAYAIEANK